MRGPAPRRDLILRTGAIRRSSASVSRPQQLGRRNADLSPWLRRFGLCADEARRAAASRVSPPDAPLEARVRYALKSPAPVNACYAVAVSNGPA